MPNALTTDRQLIEAATAVGVRAALVDVDTFDALMLRLWRNLPGRPAMDSKVRKSLPATVDIEIPPAGKGAPLLRLNALPIGRLPSRTIAVRPREEIDWPTLRDIQRDANSRLIVTKSGDIFCWGSRATIAAAFEKRSAGIEAVDLPQEFGSGDTLMKGFAEEALAASFAREKPLLLRRRGLTPILIADAHADDLTQLEALRSEVGKLTGQVAGVFAPVDEDHPTPEKVFWAEAVRVSIAQKNGKAWAVIDPDIWIWPPRARESAREFLDERRKGRLNAKFNRILNAWVRVLSGTSERAAVIEVAAFDDDDADANPRFQLSSRTGFAWKHVG